MGSIGQWIFFSLIFKFLDKEIEIFRTNLMSGLIQWILLFGTIMVVSWIIFQGWLIVTGRSREPMMALVTNSMRVVLITLIASSFSLFGNDISDLLSNTLPRAITGLVTVDEVSPAQQIDQNLTLMQSTFALLDSYATAGGSADAWKDQLSHITTMSAVGTAGPAVVGGALLLMYKVALALFVGLGPLFIMCLLFQSTKGLFSKWLQYGIGTCFSLAVLCFMVSVAMKMVAAVGAAMFVKYTLAINGMGAMEGLNTVAMQQGGLGLVLTVLLVTCPPLAAQFFNATVGGFSAYSQFGATGSHGAGRARDAMGNPVGGGDGGERHAPSTESSSRISQESNSQARHGLNKQTLAYQSSIQPPQDEIRPNSERKLRVDGDQG